MDEQRKQNLLKALLQDLGTIYQRTDKKSENWPLTLPKSFREAVSFNAPPKEDKFGNQRLASVAEHIVLDKDKQEQQKHQYRYPLKPLSVEPDGFMPTKDQKSPDDGLGQDYKTLWAAFAREFNQLATIEDFDAYFFTVYFLLKKYFSRVPSLEAEDISLFDQARVRTALTDCQYLYDHQTKVEEQNQFLLIEGDTSGIQQFIFNMVAPQQERSRLAKRLRGRSFYLLLLTETIADYLLKQLNLTVASQLWCTGGHFALIAPNTQETREMLAACYANINRFLLKNFQGELAVVIGSVAASDEDLHKDASAVRQQLDNILEREKMRKFHNISLEDQSFQFASKPSWEGGDSYDSSVENINKEQERIGQRLTRLTTNDCRLVKKYKASSETWQEKPLVTFEFSEDFQIGWDIDTYSQADTIYLVNHPNERFWGGGDVKYGFKFIANHVDVYDPLEAEQWNEELDKQGDWDLDHRVKAGEPKGFAEMANAGARGFLGVLRMDVDHLGAIFSFGLKQEHRSLTRVAALSADMDLFFNGYLQRLCKTEFNKNSYITYAGGDDLFVVGAWDMMVQLACRIRQDFKRYTCHNRDLNISAGLFLCKGKYPINRAAEQAKYLLEDLAKENKKQEPDVHSNDTFTRRDALGIFNHRISWKEFLLQQPDHGADKESHETKILPLQNAEAQLVKAIKGHSLNRALLYKILDLHRTWETHRHLNTARMYYITVRTIRDKACRDLMTERLAQHQYLSNSSYIPILIGLAALKTKERDKEETA